MTSTIKLDAALTVERPAGDDASPRWNKLVPVGTYHRADFPGGKLVIDRRFVETMVANWHAEGKPERPVDYFHRGGSGMPGGIEEKIAAGWIKDLEVRDDGLWALIAWNKRARALILNDELRYLSPEMALNARCRRTGKPQGPTLHAAGLLLDPFFTELPRVAAAETASQPAEQATGGAMDRARLAAALGLPAEATDEQIIQRITELVAKANAAQQQTPPATTAAAQEQATKLAAFEASTVKLTERVSALETENAALTTAARAAEVKAFCDRLVDAGRLTPAVREDIEKLGLSGGVEAIRFAEKLPVVVPMGEKGVTGAANPKAQEDDALKRFNDRVAELQGTGLKFTDAHARAQVEMPDVFNRAFRFVQSKREEA